MSRQRIAIIGAQGLVGEALSRGYNNVVLKITRNDVDLEETDLLKAILDRHKIDLAINCAATVGGIEINSTKPHYMLQKNIYSGLSVIRACIESNVSGLVQFISNCCYPIDAIQPYKETDLFKGKCIDSNLGYSAAKMAILQAGQAAEIEHGLRVFNIVPCSLYGYNDNYRKNQSHFIPSLIRRVHEAVKEELSSIEFYGTGKPYREIMFADELIGAINIIVEAGHTYNPINVGSGYEVNIRQTVNMICEYAGYKGKIDWDQEKPDGAKNKLLDSSEIKKLGWKPKHNVINTLQQTYNYYDKNWRLLRR